MGNTTCPEGGIMMHSGLDLNLNEQLETEEVVNQTVLCNGLGGHGFNGTNGTNGATGAGALVDKVAAPAYICADGFLVRFGVDDGATDGEAHNGVEQGEVRETLNFCFEPLRSERVSDVVQWEDSMTTGCDQAVCRRLCRASSSPPTTASTVANSMFIIRNQHHHHGGRPPPQRRRAAGSRPRFFRGGRRRTTAV